MKTTCNILCYFERKRNRINEQQYGECVIRIVK